METFTLDEILSSIDYQKKILPEDKYNDILRLYNITPKYLKDISIDGYKLNPTEYARLLNLTLVLTEETVLFYDKEETI